MESRRRILKIQCNYSRNWVTIIRPLVLRLKINKQKEMLTFQTLDMGTCSQDFLFHQKSIQKRFVLK